MARNRKLEPLTRLYRKANRAGQRAMALLNADASWENRQDSHSTPQHSRRAMKARKLRAKLRAKQARYIRRSLKL